MRAGASKYHAKPCMVDNIRFHSQKEAKRYGELKLLEKAGQIHGLTLQPRLRLCPWVPEYRRAPIGVPSIGDYVADFAYCTHDVGAKVPHATGTCVVEDVKGFKTPLYRWKKKHVMAQYGIEIQEV